MLEQFMTFVENKNYAQASDIASSRFGYNVVSLYDGKITVVSVEPTPVENGFEFVYKYKIGE